MEIPLYSSSAVPYPAVDCKNGLVWLVPATTVQCRTVHRMLNQLIHTNRCRDIQGAIIGRILRRLRSSNLTSVLNISVRRSADNGRVSGYSVRNQMTHFLGNLMGIVSWGQIGHETALIRSVIIDQDESDENEEAGESVTAQNGCRTCRTIRFDLLMRRPSEDRQMSIPK
jgi:hypothetical protein